MMETKVRAMSDIPGRPGQRGSIAYRDQGVRALERNHEPVMFEGAQGCLVAHENLSIAWLRAFAHQVRPGVSAISPLSVTVTSFIQGVPQETREVRALIDAALSRAHLSRKSLRSRATVQTALTCEAVSNTIFPSSLWHPGASRNDLYARYRKVFPRLKRDKRNRRGLYFDRLVNYGRGPCAGNQLENMILAWRKGVRRVSAFQATLCDPARDLTTLPQQGFPCLQQVSVHPSESEGSLAITGYYGTQYLFERAYGNYLGLCRLGNFLAHEMGLALVRMTCVASYAPLYGIQRAAARQLVAAAEAAAADV